MFGLGTQELVIILVIVLVLFGANRLPDLARSLGSSMKEFKKGVNDGKTDDACKKLDDLDKTAARKLTDPQYAVLLPAVQAARSAIGC